MSRIKFLLTVGCSCLAAMVFTSCSGADDDDGGGSSVSSSSSRRGGDSSGSTEIIDPDIPCAQEVDPLTQFCWGGEIYERCGNEEYDPSTRFCFQNKFYLKCNGLKYEENDPNSYNSYNPLLQFCSDGELYLRCNGKERDPSDEFCFDSKTVFPKCDGEIFNPDEQFCLEGELIDKCGGDEYLPTEEFCSKAKKTYPRCGTANHKLYGRGGYDPLEYACCGSKTYSIATGETYSIATEFCPDGKNVIDKCGGETYHPEYEFCEEPEIYSLCDGERYDPSEFFCFKDKRVRLCDGEEYDRSKYACPNDELILLCGGKERDPDNEFCSGGEIVLKCGGEDYLPDTQFCTKDKEVADKCDGSEYVPSEEFCYGGKIYSKCKDGGIFPDGSHNPFTHTCCGDETISTESQFCSEEEKKPYDYCNNEKYDTQKEFCDADRNDPSKERIYPRCDGEKYTVSDRFCFGNKFYLLCGGKEYNPLTNFCSNREIHLRCGGKPADPVKEFCFDGKIYDKCGGEEYNVDEQFCYKGVTIIDMCRDLPYDDETQYCEDFKIKNKCRDGALYVKPDPTEQCVENVIYDKCSTRGNSCGCTDPNKLCSRDNIVYSLCEGKAYNEIDDFCSIHGTIIKWCNSISVKYDPKTEFCPPNGIDPPIPLCPVKTYDNMGNVIGIKLTPYDTDEKQCDGDAIVDKGTHQTCSTLPDGKSKEKSDYFCCFGNTYRHDGDYFCDPDNNVLVAKCKRTTAGVPEKYNLKYDICYNNLLKPRCLTTDGLTGPCVHNNVLRCKQLGDGSNYIIDPLVGMKCEATGEIAGNVAGIGDIVQIGNQIWTKENIGTGECPGKYGCRYDWVEAMSLQAGSGLEAPKDNCYSTSEGKCTPSLSENLLWRSICPEGFGIPRPRDWEILVEYAGGAKIAAGRLKSTTGWNDNGNGTDNYGFSALPGGYDVNLGGVVTLYEQGDRSIWWTFTQTESEAWYFDMISADTEVRTHYRPKKGGAYVRCVRYGAF